MARNPPNARVYLGDMPTVDMFGGGHVCVPIPVDAIPLLVSALEPYQLTAAWRGSPGDRLLATAQVSELIYMIAALRCGSEDECTTEQAIQLLTDEMILSAAHARGLLTGHCACEKEEQMPGITEITCEDGKLIAHYGPCCSVVVCDISEMYSAIDTADGSADDLPDGYQSEPPGADWSCRDASAVVSGMVSLLTETYDIVNSSTPVTWVREFNDRLPWVGRSSWRTFGMMAAFAALSEAADEVLLGSGQPGLTEVEQAEMRCRIAAVMDGVNGITDNEMEHIRAAINMAIPVSSIENGWVDSLLMFPARAGYDRLVKMQRWTEEPDCACPNPSAVPESPATAYEGWYFGPEVEIEINSTTSSGWTPTHHDFGEQSHDVCGYVITQFTKSTGQLKRMSSSTGTSMHNDSNDIGEYGVNVFTTVSGAAVPLEEYFQSKGVGYKISSTGRPYGTLSSPVLSAPVTPVTTWNLGFNKNATAVVKMRLVFHTGSPSHS